MVNCFMHLLFCQEYPGHVLKTMRLAELTTTVKEIETYMEDVSVQVVCVFKN